jgi:putative ABC transport system permease protein
MSFILAKAQTDVSAEEIRRNIEKETGLIAMSGDDFQWRTISYYIKNTGIPVNFGVTVAIAIVVGTVVAGQTFYLFAIDNLKQFAALKAVGVTNLRLVGMILLQALVVAVIGYSLGMAMCASFFDLTQGALALRGFIFLWQLMAATSVLVIFIVALASLMSIQRVLTVEPATVFRG